MARHFGILVLCIALAALALPLSVAAAQPADLMVTQSQTYDAGTANGKGLLDILDDLLDPLLEVLDDLVDTLDNVLKDVIGVLPVPILGPDAYEPDNSIEDANFVELLVGDLLDTITDLLPFLKTHNFHTADDEDWHQFYAQELESIVVQTFNLYPGADTNLVVYRVWNEDEVLPTTTPEGCDAPYIATDNGEILVPVACNDDISSSDRRSQVAFIAPREGVYYSRVTQSPKASTKGVEEGGTTYQYMASSKGFFGGSLHVSVRAAIDGSAVHDATVTVFPLNLANKYNNDGVYSFHGIPANQYQFTVDAPGSKRYTSFATVEAGQSQFVYCALVPVEDEGPDEVVEGEEETIPLETDYSDAFGSTISPQQAHSADYAAPYGKFSISEILRVIQFLNLGRYGCNPGSEDGFAAAGDRHDCNPHAADFQPQDWKIGLSEALRVIQLYNVDRYQPCEDSEDGFCLFVNI